MISGGGRWFLPIFSKKYQLNPILKHVWKKMSRQRNGSAPHSSKRTLKNVISILHWNSCRLLFGFVDFYSWILTKYDTAVSLSRLDLPWDSKVNTWIFIQFWTCFVDVYYFCRLVFQLVIRPNHTIRTGR